MSIRTPGASEADVTGLQPLKTARRRWPTILGALLTIAMTVGLARELFGDGLAGLQRAVPDDPRFYLFFALLYMASPIGEYVIFRRLWRIPAAGLVALLKKRIANDVVVDYSGAAYFYAWARAHADIVASPFGAIKDVTILSAIAGNAITLLMVVLAVPLARDALGADMVRTILGSAAIVATISLPFLIFSRRVFSLPRPTLWWVFGVHVVRLICSSLFLALAWHHALPGVAIGMWLALAAGRLLVSRLPLVPNKDLLFANVSILLIGQDRALSELIAFTAALTLLAHLALVALFGLHALAQRMR